MNPTVVGAIIGAGAAVIVALASLWANVKNTRATTAVSRSAVEAAQRTVELSEQGQVTDRYSKAVEQLGSERLDVRLGAIYALERIMIDSPRDHPTIVDVLAAYVRGHAPHDTNAARKAADRDQSQDPVHDRLTEPATDVQAALTVPGRRPSGPTERGNLGLNGTRPGGARLFDAHLAHADLRWADLRGADLRGADLRGADLHGVNLRFAYLGQADLGGAFVRSADLRYADMRGANLADSHLNGENLGDAYVPGPNLTGAHLTGANLSNADLSHARLTDADLSRAPDRRGPALCALDRGGPGRREPDRGELARRTLASRCRSPGRLGA